MTITSETTVAAIATALPATIKIFQQHHIDFCCGGKVPLAEACATRGLNADDLLAELRALQAPARAQPSWHEVPMTVVIAHIQARYHQPLRLELPRLGAMLDKVVQRHGDSLGETLPRLQATFQSLQDELLEHMQKEDAVLFPFIVRLEGGEPLVAGDAALGLLEAPIATLESEHAQAGAALETMRELTNGYAPPEWACPTFRGLYYGLAQLESEMHMHVHLENHVLFPRAAQLARERRLA